MKFLPQSLLTVRSGCCMMLYHNLVPHSHQHISITFISYHAIQYNTSLLFLNLVIHNRKWRNTVHGIEPINWNDLLNYVSSKPWMCANAKGDWSYDVFISYQYLKLNLHNVIDVFFHENKDVQVPMTPNTLLTGSLL